MIIIIYFVYNHINILHQNINGLIMKSDQLNVCIDELHSSGTRIDVICITEHNMVQGDEQCLCLPNFNLASTCMRQSRHGGCCILVKYSHIFNNLHEINNLSIIGVVEFCAVELLEHKMCIVCVYRAPKVNSSSFDIFFDKLNLMITKLLQYKKKIILCGDFNIDMLKSDKYAKEFEFLLLTYNLNIEIKEPTRLASNTCIDNFAHNLKGCKSKVVELALSDHTAQILKCPVQKSCNIKFWFIYKRDYSIVNRKKFVNYLEQSSFQDVYDEKDPNTAFDMFYDWFRLLYDLCFPRKKIKIFSDIKPKWISKGIKICSKRKRELLWKYRTSPSEENKLNLDNYSKRYRKIINLTQKNTK